MLMYKLGLRFVTEFDINSDLISNNFNEGNSDLSL